MFPKNSIIKIHTINTNAQPINVSTVLNVITKKAVDDIITAADTINAKTYFMQYNNDIYFFIIFIFRSNLFEIKYSYSKYS